MPHFLVSYTALVEADDESTAVAKVYGEICDGESITFRVTADEQATIKITIPTRTGKELGNTFGGTLLTYQDAPVITSVAQPVGQVVDVDRPISMFARFSRLSMRIFTRSKRD